MYKFEQPIRFNLAPCIHESDPFKLGGFVPNVAATAGRSRAGFDDAVVGVVPTKLFCESNSLVCRATIDQNDLIRRQQLPLQRADEFMDRTCLVPHGNNHRNSHRFVKTVAHGVTYTLRSIPSPYGTRLHTSA